jgi:hypothetical protein
LSRYPRGPHVADAERRLAILSASAAPPSDFAPEGFADLPPPPPDELVYADRPVFLFQGPDFGPPPRPAPCGFVAVEGEEWRDLPPPRPSVEAGVLPALIVAIPLIATARPYRDAGGGTGRAAPGAPPPVAQASPPPLPGGVKPTPTPTRTPLKVVKPTPTPSPTPSATPFKASNPPPADTTPKPIKPTSTPSRAPEKQQEKKPCGKAGEPACPK